MQNNHESSTATRIYKPNSQTPQFMPKPRKTLDSPIQPLPKAMKV